MNFHKRTVFWLIAVCVSLSFCNNVNSFNLHDSPGEIWPSRIEIAVGDSVNIFCHMNLTAFQNKYTAKDLYFVDISTQKVVPETDIAILNKTTVMYKLVNAPEQQTSYRCMCRSHAIDDAKVFVGYSPQPVTDFTCRSYDFMRMQCNFTKPDNPVFCKYNLSFHFDSPHYKYYPKCVVASPLVICDAVGIYRAKEEIYHYELFGTNNLGNLTQRFDINNTEVMVPAKPGQDFQIINISTDSALFSFRMPNSYHSKGLQWELFLKPLNLSEYTIHNAVKHNVRNECSLQLLNLKYAFYEYHLRLRVRLQGAHAWSQPFVYKFRTLPRRPDRPPRIDVGGFYIDPSETSIHLYWELLHPYEFNGHNFSYVIENQNGEKFTTDSNSASFPWHKNNQYEFKLRSLNHLGTSETFSYITIPAMWPTIKSKTHTTPAVHNIYHETNGTFTLTWEAPNATSDLVDYTVFWCRSKRALLNGCEGSIHFEHIAANIHKFTTSRQEHTLNLAVSANYKDFNTGMHWTECTMNEESDLVKMEPEVVVTSATTLKIQWTSEKICPSIFDGYNISFCEVAEPEITINEHSNDNDGDDDDEDVDYVTGVQYNCSEGSTRDYKLISKTQNRYELTDLKPYTMYRVEMFMYSMRKVGKTSDPQFLRTSEAAPSHPRHLNVSHITNTSASISWLPPREPNGIVRNYTIVLNNERCDIPADLSDTDGRITYNLKNLNSSTSYKVYVLAHTISSSQPSNDIHFTTLVGYPKTPTGVDVTDSNNQGKLKWDKSTERTDYYEVAITVMQNDSIIRRRISVVMDMNDCVYKIPHCVDPTHRTTVDVRAVNAALLTHEVNENDTDDTTNAYAYEEQYYEGNDDLSCIAKVGTTEKQTKSILERQRNSLKRFKDLNKYRLYKSNWQRGTVYNCSSGELGIFFLYSASAVLIFVSFLVLFYFMRRTYNKMANIHCTLPPGLDAYVSKDFNSVNGSTFPHDFLAVFKGEISSNTRSGESNDSTKITKQASDYHNEEHHLLETTSQDSVSLHEQTNKQQPSTVPKTVDLKTSNEIGIANNPMFDHKFDLQFSPQETQNRINENIQPTSVGNANYIQAADFTNTHAMPQFPTPITNCYIKPNALANWQNIVAQPTATASPSGYVSVESIDVNTQAVNKPPVSNALHEFSVPNNSGYIQANFLERTKPNLPSAHITANQPPILHETALQTPLNHTTDSYTTLEQLNKMSTTFPATNNWNRESIISLTQDLGIPIVPPTNVTPGISGYVTPRELTAFGQQQQQQHSLN